MIEPIWAGLLALAVCWRQTRLLAGLLAIKWATNYAAFTYAEWAPVYVDLILGSIGTAAAARIHRRWADFVIAGFVLTPLVHAWYWAGLGMAHPVTYYWLVIGLFTAQVLAVAWPGGRIHVASLVRRVDRAVRRRLAGRGPDPVPGQGAAQDRPPG